MSEPHHPHPHHPKPVEPPDNLQGGPMGKWWVLAGVTAVVVAFIWAMTIGLPW